MRIAPLLPCSLRRRTGRRSQSRRGMILILVMWVAMALVALAINFGDSMIMEYRASDNALASREADQAMEGSRRYVTLLLTNNPTPGQPLDPTTYEAEQVPVGDAAFWLIGRSALLNPPADVRTYGLVDEASKLNCNTATADMLAALPGMTPEFAASIYNWCHASTDVAQGGATAQNYEMLDDPYEPKNAPFETVEELRLVYPSDPSQPGLSILLGKDRNLNGVLEDNEIQTAPSIPNGVVPGIPDYGIFEYVTIYSREPNSTTSTVNVATAGTATGNPVEGPLRTVLETANVSPDHEASAVAALPSASLLEFYMKSGMTATEFAQVESQLSVSAATSIVGRVNVNTASAAVLECLTGMTQALAEQIVNTRQNQTLDQLASIAWVASVITDQTVAAQVGPLITTHSYQFSADIAAVGHNGRGFRRTLFVLDTSGSTPVVIYSRDRTRSGWPLGSAVREEYQSQEKP